MIAGGSGLVTGIGPPKMEDAVFGVDGSAMTFVFCETSKCHLRPLPNSPSGRKEVMVRDD